MEPVHEFHPGEIYTEGCVSEFHRLSSRVFLFSRSLVLFFFSRKNSTRTLDRMKFSRSLLSLVKRKDAYLDFFDYQVSRFCLFPLPPSPIVLSHFSRFCSCCCGMFVFLAFLRCLLSIPFHSFPFLSFPFHAILHSLGCLFRYLQGSFPSKSCTWATR